MKNTIELLKVVETNLVKLGWQYKSGQHVLICDALDSVKEAMQNVGATQQSVEPTLKKCPSCGADEGNCFVWCPRCN
jgi:hypothetical protein